MLNEGVTNTGFTQKFYKDTVSEECLAVTQQIKEKIEEKSSEKKAVSAAKNFSFSLQEKNIDIETQNTSLMAQSVRY